MSYKDAVMEVRRFHLHTVIEYFLTDWRIGFIVADGVAAGAGLISARLIPRGPVTTTHKNL